MKAELDPDQIPGPLRTIGRLILPQTARHHLAQHLNDRKENRWRKHPIYDENQRRLENLRNSHAHDTAVIIGNGPSMADFDLSRLDGTISFCLNRGTLLWREQNRVPNYLVISNELVIDEFSEEIRSFDTQKIIPWRASDKVPQDEQTMYFHLRWKRMFHRDLLHGLWAGGTVTFAAMQIAWHMGFRNVILIGVDHSFAFDGAPNETQIANGPDQNHFHPDYFSGGHLWQTPDLETSEIAYRMARETFVRDGRRITNATDGGALDIFPRFTLEDALKMSGNAAR